MHRKALNMAVKKNEVELTLEDKRILEEKVQQLETYLREDVAERIKVAREFGDISENSEFDDAQNERMAVERELAETKHTLATAKFVEKKKKMTTSKVVMTHIVTLADDEGKERTFQIVGSVEAKGKKDKISGESPLGKALLGRKKGDVVEYDGPTGRHMKFTIVKIQNPKAQD